MVAEPFQEPGIITEPLYDEPFFVIVPKGHEFEELDAVSVQQLTEQQVLLLSEGNCMRDQVLESCSKLASRQRILGLANTLPAPSRIMTTYCFPSSPSSRPYPTAASYWPRAATSCARRPCRLCAKPS